MPPNLQSVDGITVYSADTDYYEIEKASYATIMNLLPGDDSTVSSTSVASMQGLTGVLETDQEYKFTVYLTGDIPMNGYYTLEIPTTVGLPASPATDLTLTCDSLCTASAITLSYSN